ncbi:hypothetical protein [Enterococcus sp. AZ163]
MNTKREVALTTSLWDSTVKDGGRTIYFYLKNSRAAKVTAIFCRFLAI